MPVKTRSQSSSPEGSPHLPLSAQSVEMKAITPKSTKSPTGTTKRGADEDLRAPPTKWVPPYLREGYRDRSTKLCEASPNDKLNGNWLQGSRGPPRDQQYVPARVPNRGTHTYSQARRNHPFGFYKPGKIIFLHHYTESLEESRGVRADGKLAGNRLQWRDGIGFVKSRMFMILARFENHYIALPPLYS